MDISDFEDIFFIQLLVILGKNARSKDFGVVVGDDVKAFMNSLNQLFIGFDFSEDECILWLLMSDFHQEEWVILE